MADLFWYKNAVFYEVYVRAFYDSNGDGTGDPNGLTQKLDYLQSLGVDCLWLLPIYPSPLKDDGYDISDYTSILPEYGSLEDFKNLLAGVHARNMRLIMDLVVNHTSDQHPWFQAARSDKNSPYRDYYVWSDSDEKYSQARIIFIDSEKSNWSWDAQAGQYYWHRFYACQPDLNFDHPAVRAEIFRILRFWLDMGVDGFRADAVPYLFERDGTDCENLPETHAFLKELRRFVDSNYPGRILLCEANQWPKDVRPYLGDGDEFQLAFHFPLMPRIFMGLKRADLTPIKWILEQTPAIPEDCQWCIFLRNHDELTLEMVSEQEREWLWRLYSPDSKMRLNLGIRRRLAPLLDNDRRRIELAFSLLFSLPGSPIIYYGDEIGMGDNIRLPDRNGLRTPMQWNNGQNAGFSMAKNLFSPVITEPEYGPERVNVALECSDETSLWNAIKNMITIHKQFSALCCGELTWLDCGTSTVAAYERKTEHMRILIINNLSNQPQSISVPLSGYTDHVIRNILSGQNLHIAKGKHMLDLKPYAYQWFLVQS